MPCVGRKAGAANSSYGAPPIGHRPRKQRTVVYLGDKSLINGATYTDRDQHFLSALRLPHKTFSNQN
jgi:hypothetical protein